MLETCVRNNPENSGNQRQNTGHSLYRGEESKSEEKAPEAGPTSVVVLVCSYDIWYSCWVSVRVSCCCEVPAAPETSH